MLLVIPKIRLGSNLNSFELILTLNTSGGSIFSFCFSVPHITHCSDKNLDTSFKTFCNSCLPYLALKLDNLYAALIHFWYCGQLLNVHLRLLTEDCILMSCGSDSVGGTPASYSLLTCLRNLYEKIISFLAVMPILTTAILSLSVQKETV